MPSSRFFSLLSLAALGCIPTTLPAVEAMKFEAVLYLFKTESISKIDFSKALSGQPSISRNAIVVTPPATIVFDEEVLSLDAGYTWNGGQTVPSRFSETKLPGMETLAGRSITVRIDVPVQFLEKMQDGSLQVREIPRNSADAPRYQLTLDAQPAPGAPKGYDLKVTCQMDISTMQGREKISGVDLDVGRPITSRFDRKIEYWGRKGEWFGIMANQEQSGDYTLLILLKISSAGEAPAAASVVRPRKPEAQLPPAEGGIVARLAVSATGVTDLSLGMGARGRADRPDYAWERRIRFGLKLQGPGPVYREFEVRAHGTDFKTPAHEGTVTIDPKQQWVVIDLHEVVSKPGQPRRTEPCAANGRYPVEMVGLGNEGWQSHQGLMTPNSGPTPGELAVPAVPNGPYVQPK